MYITMKPVRVVGGYVITRNRKHNSAESAVKALAKLGIGAYVVEVAARNTIIAWNEAHGLVTRS